MKNPLKNLDKKQKFGVFALSIILLVSVMSITGNLPLASLFGGDSDNVFGGTFSTSETSQSGDITTSFAECDVSDITISLTNNANDPFTLTGQPAYKIVEVQITSTEDDSDYQVKIPVTSLTGMNSDLSNIRFQTSDGTEIPQWRESYVADTSAEYWIKTDLITGDNVIHVVYGGDLSLKSDIDSVMVFGDEFEGVSLDTSKWDVKDGSFSVSNGIATYVGDSYADSYTTISNGQILEFSAKMDNSGYSYIGLVSGSYSSRWFGWFASEYSQMQFSSFTTSTERTNVGTSDEQYHTFRIDKISDTDRNGYLDEILKGTHTGTLSDANIRIGGNAGSVWATDWVRVRKYMATEPSVAIQTPSDMSMDFTKMQILTIDNTGGAELTGYQHLETITYDSDMQPDFNDLVFTETDGTVLSHYIDSYTASTEAEVFIKIDANAASSKDIYMYYGNSEIVDLSDNSIFELFDDFNGENLDLTKWSGDTGDISLSNGLLSLSSTTTTWKKLETIDTFGHGYSLNTKAKFGLASADKFAAISFRNDANSESITYDTNGFNLRYYSTSGGSFDPATTADSSYTEKWATYEIGRTSAGNHFIRDGIEETNSPITTYNSNTALPIEIKSYNNIVNLDYIFVCKYTATPPTLSFGTETTLVNPTITASCTGDSNSQTYGLETKEVSLTPSGAISQFDISGSFNYDFDATLSYSGATSITSQNATSGDIEFTFTPTVAIEEGYANAIFSEDIILEYPSVSATLDDVAVEAVFENNNTVSILLSDCDTSLHTVVATVVNEAPVVPSSGGGGGSGGSSIASEEVVETTDIATNNEESQQTTDFKLLNGDISMIILYLISGLLAAVILYKVVLKK